MTTDMDPNDERYVDTSYTKEPDQEVKPAPEPGAYYLQFGTVTAAYREPYPGTRGDGSKFVIPGKVEAVPKLTIVSDADGDTTFSGYEVNRFYRLDTEAVRFRGQTKNFSTLSAACALAGVTFPETGKVSDIIAAAESLSGLTTTKPVTLTLQGEVKYKNYFVKADGTRCYLDEKVFRRGDQSLKLAEYKATGAGWARVGFIVDGEFTLATPPQKVDAVKVFANLQPTDFGWKPRG